jgi:Tfp pilus assembly protein PilV
MSWRDGQAGFSLAEVLVTAAFAVLFGALIYSFTVSSFRAASAQQARSEAQDTAYLALSLLTRDLRQAGAAPAAEGPLPLVRAQETSIAVQADFNGDGDCEDSGESLAYAEDATRHTLTRASGGAAPQPLADHLAPGSLRFAYYDADGTLLDAGGSGLDPQQRRRVRRVDAAFALAVPFEPGPTWLAVSASVEVRNAR